MGSATAVLGKRKRVKNQKPAAKPKADDADVVDNAALEDAQAIFRRHFEAQFVPLQEETASGPSEKDGKKGGKKSDRAETETDDDGEAGVEDLRSDSEDEEDDGDDDSEDDDGEWGGLSGEDSEPEAENKVEVVDHSKPLDTSSVQMRQALMGMTKREMRAYLSSKPPDALSEAEEAKARKQLLLNQKKNGGGDDDDAQNEDSRALLAKDLELSRLISESHILSAANPFNTTTSGAAGQAFASGRARALTTDLRMQGLGSKGSIFTQQKMPMGMRKGITGAKAMREERRRREARENGIILERPAEGDNDKKSGGKRRKREGPRGLAVDMPGMGKMRNGELRLSKHEVRAVEMEGKRFDNGKKRRRRR